jgi:nicotinic acid mononucleotide adenylyltransferase
MRLVDAAAPRRTETAAKSESTLIFLIDATTADVSSTAIRQARQHHQSIAGMVPPSVQQHIEQHALYDAQLPAAEDGDSVLGAQAGRLHGQK